MRILVVDDNDQLRKDAVDAVLEVRAEMPSLEVVGEAADGLAAILAIERLKPDLVLLDVEMPILDGFEVVAQLGADPPAIIFITVYEQYALRAFDVSAADFIVKPIEIERLKHAIERARRLRKEQSPADAVRQNERLLEAVQSHRYLHRIVGRQRGILVPILVKEIYAFTADGYLVIASTAEGRYLIEHTLRELETKLNPDQFVRAHRGILVNLSYITQIEHDPIGFAMLRLKDGSSHRISRSGLAKLNKRLES
jgi:two-component system LytT family response regulator